jgi:hypothetical protein
MAVGCFSKIQRLSNEIQMSKIKIPNLIYGLFTKGDAAILQNPDGLKIISN